METVNYPPWEQPVDFKEVLRRLTEAVDDPWLGEMLDDSVRRQEEQVEFLRAHGRSDQVRAEQRILERKRKIVEELRELVRETKEEL